MRLAMNVHDIISYHALVSEEKRRGLRFRFRDLS